MSLTAQAGGECVGVTLTVDENVGSNVLAMRRASRQLNLSDHFWLSSVILVSVADLLSNLTVLALEVVGSSFLGFLLDSSLTLGDCKSPCSFTAPMTGTVARSTKEALSLLGVEEASSFLASRISFLNL